MRFFVTLLFIVFLSSGCTIRNAYSNLSLDGEQEQAIEQTRNGKIKNNQAVEGIYSVIYLNNADKDTDREEDEFYVSVYLKNKYDLNITMNGEDALEVLKLETTNAYSHYLAQENSWTTNYFVSFESNETKTLTLKIDSGLFSSGPLVYVKDEQ